jgi:hypothetical protein
VTLPRRFPFGHAPHAVTARAAEVLDVTAPLPERHTMPMEPGASRRPALPFVPVAPLPPVIREMAPLPADAAPPRSRARRWLRLALIVLGLALYVAALAAIVAPLPGRSR